MQGTIMAKPKHVDKVGFSEKKAKPNNADTKKSQYRKGAKADASIQQKAFSKQ